MAPSTKPDIVFGAMTFGKAGSLGPSLPHLNISLTSVRQRTSPHLQFGSASILDTFQKYNHNEIDTSRVYGGGTSDPYLNALKWHARGLVVDTKYLPNVHGLMGQPVTNLDLKSLTDGLAKSLSELGTEKVELWYRHAPDRSVPLEETLQAVNELYKEGKFKRWGVSIYMSWEVATICGICDKEGYPRPSVYQGVYNALHRSVEHELFPCLRKYGVEFYAFNLFAGGYLIDRYHRATRDGELELGSRFDSNRWQGKMYSARYWNDAFFDALDIIRPVLKKEGIRESEAAPRWMMHHSQLKREYGDKVITGASSEQQLEVNLKDLEGKELPVSVLEALDRAWEGCRGVTWKYFH